MKIFVLEDDPYRTNKFTDIFLGNAILITPDADIAIRAIEKEKHDIIFLDHDLGLKLSKEKTGYTVARTIKDTINRETPVVIHSFNPVGVKNIQSVLVDNPTIVAPFGTFDKSIINRFKTLRG